MPDVMLNQSHSRYSTAKEYVETIKLALSSPHHKGQHVIIAVRPTHLLAGFALELYLKAWLLADGEDEKKVEKYGHKLIDLHAAAVNRGFPKVPEIESLVGKLAEPHGQNRDYVFRYTELNHKIDTLDWVVELETFHKIDLIVDTHVGASKLYGMVPGH